jgi:hypothetical protein
VTRGICRVDENGYLTDIEETGNIVKTINNGMVGAEVEGTAINSDSYVSMNMWGLSPDFMNILENGFEEFFNKIVPNNSLKAEYLLPIIVGDLLKKEKVTVKVLETSDKWFGVTYKEDKLTVVENFKKLINDGVYSENLFSDLV